MKNRFNVTDKITILGSSGCGKTRLGRKLNQMWPRTVIIDPLQEYDDGVKGENTFYSFDLFCRKLIELKKENAKKFKLVFRFGPDIDEETQKIVLNEILRVLYNYKNLQIVIDEVHLYCTTQWMPLYLKNLLLMGRHQGISLLCITQRPAQLNKTILAQSKHVFAGQLHDKNDLNYISNFINIDQNIIINLEIGKFVYFSPGEKPKIIEN